MATETATCERHNHLQGTRSIHLDYLFGQEIFPLNFDCSDAIVEGESIKCALSPYGSCPVYTALAERAIATQRGSTRQTLFDKTRDKKHTRSLMI